MSGKAWIVAGVVLAALAGGAWWIWEEDLLNGGFSGQRDPIRSTSCAGGLFDSHIHLDDDELGYEIASRMVSHNVRCGVLFVHFDLADSEESFDRVREALGDTPGVFVPFYDVLEDRSTTVSRASLDELYEKHGETFKGFGEFALYRPDLAGTDLTRSPWPELFEFAGERNLMLMIHLSLDPADQTRLETMLARHPKTRVLIHGFERGGTGFAALLRKHPNLYFTLDTATLLKDNPRGAGKHLLYPDGRGSADQFIADYDQNKAKLLQQARDEWLQVILAAPDRVLWGTDMSFEWHTDERVYSRLIDFTHEVIAQLPVDVQEKYAYQNAVRLFGEQGVTVDPLDDDDGDDEEDDDEDADIEDSEDVNNY